MSKRKVTSQGGAASAGAVSGPASADLLDIHEAARLLKVSAVSLRRWTADGRLPCTRIGGRRERRFHRRDLETFLGASLPDAMAPVAPLTTRRVRIEDLEVPYGSHLCAFYETDAGRLKLALPFLREGLQQGDRCFLVAAPTVSAAFLARLGPAATVAAGALTVHAGTARPEALYAQFRDALLQAAATGTRCRIVGDMAGFLQAGATLEDLVSFETRFNHTLAHHFAVVALCQYDTRVFTGSGVVAALRCHEDTLRYPLGRFLGV